jgi:hypothetical protein
MQVGIDGQLVLLPAMIDNGSYDECKIVDYTLSRTLFDCSNIGVNSVTLTVSDPSGNKKTCNASVTLLGNFPPVAANDSLRLLFDTSGATSVLNNDKDNSALNSSTLVIVRQPNLQNL